MCVRLTLGGDFTDVCVVFVVSPFIRALFPENVEAEKRGRPSTASTKIKVRESAAGVLVSASFYPSSQPVLW